MRFSIVTPSYNQAATIGQTIESVLSQEGDFEIEYLVIDGASNDDSVEVIRRYDQRVAEADWPARCTRLQFHWVSEPDDGQASAINKGFRRATGDIVSWINSDDYYLPRAFTRVATAFARNPRADFVYGDGDMVDAAGNVLGQWLSRPFNLAVLTSYHYLWNDFTNYIMQQSAFWRRSVFDRIGFLDESLHFTLDVEFWIRAGAAGLTLCHVPEKLGAFRWAEGTKSLSGPTVFWEDYLEIFRRYRGVERLGTLLGYYYYNVARHLDVPPFAAREEAQATAIAAAERRLFDRWSSLSGSEKERLRDESKRGLDMCRLLLANELLGQGAAEPARHEFEAAVASRRWLMIHPFGLWYLLRSAIGARASGWLTRIGQLAVACYRRYRVDYRYYA